MVLVLMALITFFSFFGVESFKETASTFSQLKENMDGAEALIEVTLCLNSILAHDLMNLCVLYRFHIKKKCIDSKGDNCKDYHCEKQYTFGVYIVSITEAEKLVASVFFGL